MFTIETLNVQGVKYDISDANAVKSIKFGTSTYYPTKGVINIDFKDLVVTSGEVVLVTDDERHFVKDKSYRVYRALTTRTDINEVLVYLPWDSTTPENYLECKMFIDGEPWIHNASAYLYSRKVGGAFSTTQFVITFRGLMEPSNNIWIEATDYVPGLEVITYNPPSAGLYLKLTIANQEEPVYIDVNDLTGTLDYDTLINTPLFKGSGTGFSKGEQLNKNNLTADTFIIEGISGDLYKIDVVKSDEFYDGEYRHNRVIIYNKDNEVIYLTAAVDNITEDDYGNAVIVEGAEGNLDYSYNDTYTLFNINNNSISDIPSNPDVFACVESTSAIQINPDYKEFFDSLGGESSQVVELEKSEYDLLVADGLVEPDVTYYVKTNDADNSSAVINDSFATPISTYSSSKIEEIKAQIDGLLIDVLEKVAIQPNWLEDNESSLSYIKNKPENLATIDDIHSADWTAVEGEAGYILNKPDNLATVDDIKIPDWNAELGEDGFILNKPNLTDLPKYLKLNDDLELIVDASTINLNTTTEDATTSTAVLVTGSNVAVSTYSNTLDGINPASESAIDIIAKLNTGVLGDKTAKISAKVNGTSSVDLDAQIINLNGRVLSNGMEIQLVKYLSKAEWDELLAGDGPLEDITYYIEDANPTYGTVSYVSVTPQTVNIDFNNEMLF